MITNIGNPTVSVILPTHNPKMDWIVLAIKSVLNQTYQNFELILIDDSSTNDVLDKIKDLINSDDRILFIRNNENLKLTKTLNTGIGIAKGKYIARIDDDDIWNNEKKLEKQVQFLEKNISYGLVGTGVILIDENNDAIDTLKIRTSDAEIRDNILKDSQFAHASVVIRRDALEEVGLYDPDWNMVEDYELWMRIGTKYKFANLSDLFLSYRINPNGVSTKNAFKQKVMSLRLTYKYKNVYPSFFLALALKIPYTILPKSVSSFFLKLIKK